MVAYLSPSPGARPRIRLTQRRPGAGSAPRPAAGGPAAAAGYYTVAGDRDPGDRDSDHCTVISEQCAPAVGFKVLVEADPGVHCGSAIRFGESRLRVPESACYRCSLGLLQYGESADSRDSVLSVCVCALPGPQKLEGNKNLNLKFTLANQPCLHGIPTIINYKFCLLSHFPTTCLQLSRRLFQETKGSLECQRALEKIQTRKFLWKGVHRIISSGYQQESDSL